MRVLIGDPPTATNRINLSAIAKGRLEPRLVEKAADILAQVEEWRPHVYIISDAFGAPMTDLIGPLRKRTNAPILLLTSCETAAQSARYLGAGADFVLCHPVADELLLATTHAMIRRVYQYSVPAPPPKAAAPTAQTPAAQATAPATREASYAMWPQCDSCGYIGPRDRFEKRDKNGNTSIACPICEHNNIRIPIG